MRMPSLTIEHMFDTCVCAGAPDGGGSASELDAAIEQVNALREADARWRKAEAERARMIVDTILTVTAALKGEQALVPRSSSGTPLIAEFAHLELAAALGCSPSQTLQELYSLLGVRFRLPRLWDRVMDAEIPVWKACHVHSLTSTLSESQCATLDELLGQIGSWNQGRITRHVNLLIARVAPQMIEVRAELAERARRVVFDMDEGVGSAYMHAQLAITDALHLDRTVASLASALAASHPDESVDERRSRALGLLANPEQAGALLNGREAKTERRAEIVAHIYPDSPHCASIDDGGSVPVAQLASMLAHTRVTIRPVLDYSSLPAGDRHDPTPMMRRALLQREPFEVFPYSNTPSTSCDLDHTVPYEEGGPAGQTNLANLGPLSRSVHRAKTHAGWDLDQPEPGVYQWTTPLGFRYDVVNGITRYRGHMPPQRE